jgi:uncharacterized protein YecE (DUF72 family)
LPTELTPREGFATTPGRVLVGTCNWADHSDFYPPGMPASERLAHYARFFPLVEVDTTFYGIPRPAVAERWAEVTPPGFLFNVKAYRSLTMHERVDGKPRPATEAEEHDFLAVLDPLRAAGKLRAVHYQFPPWFTASPASMDYVSRLPDRHPRDQLVVEMRHASWGQPARFEALAELLAETGITYCAVDEPQLGSASMPDHLALTSPALAMVRLHGRNRRTWYARGGTSGDRFDYRYNHDELLEWVPRVRAMADRAGEVHVLFNNNRANHAVVNGLEMAALLDLGYPSPASSELPPPPRQQPLPF